MSILYDIVIPAYNAHKELPQIINQLDHLPNKPEHVYIIDDGSSQQYSILPSKSFAIEVVRLEQNRGKGFALRKGMELFLKNRIPFLLLMDSDGQHPVTHIPDFLKNIQTDSYDLLIGNRVKKIGQMPVLRIFSNTVSSIIVSWVSGQRIADSQCGFRLLKRELVEELDLQEDGFQIETELILKAVRKGFRIGFLPIPTIYNGQKSYIKHLSDTIRFVQIVLKEILNR